MKKIIINYLRSSFHNLKFLFIILISGLSMIIGIGINAFYDLPISDEVPNWETILGLLAIFFTIITIRFQILSTERSEIDNAISNILVELNTIKLTKSDKYGSDALREYSNCTREIRNSEINVVDSLTSILIQFNILADLPRLKTNKKLKLRLYTFYYSRILWASENLILIVLYEYQVLAIHYLSLSEKVYYLLLKEKLIERNRDFENKIKLIHLTLKIYNNLEDEHTRSIYKNKLSQFSLLKESGEWQKWNEEEYEEKLRQYYSASTLPEIFNRNNIDSTQN